MKDFERVKMVRQKLGLNQVEFADNLGIEQGSLSDIERGRVKAVSMGVKRALKECFSVNIDWLETGKGEMFLPVGHITEAANTPETIASRIKKIREQLKMNQTEFGDSLGFTQAYVSSLESESAPLTAQIKLSLNEKFNINYKWLETGVGPMFIGGDTVDQQPPIVTQKVEKSYTGKESHENAENTQYLKRQLEAAKYLIESLRMERDMWKGKAELCESQMQYSNDLADIRLKTNKTNNESAKDTNQTNDGL